jgi:uncharacterized RDD family membrane protein YckC
MDCPECDAPVREGGRFCMSCGALIGPLQVVTANVMPERWVAVHTDRPPRPRALGDDYLGSASRVPRLIAWILDGLVVGIAMFVVMAVLGLEVIAADDPYFSGEARFPDINYAVLLALLIPQAAYYIVFPTTHWMATPGKKMLALRVTDASGDRLGLIQSTWRFICQWLILGVLVPFAILIVPIGIIAVPIALVIVLANTHDQSPWDMLAGTRVLE